MAYTMANVVEAHVEGVAVFGPLLEFCHQGIVADVGCIIRSFRFRRPYDTWGDALYDHQLVAELVESFHVHMCAQRVAKVDRKLFKLCVHPLFEQLGLPNEAGILADNVCHFAVDPLDTHLGPRITVSGLGIQADICGYRFRMDQAWHMETARNFASAVFLRNAFTGWIALDAAPVVYQATRTQDHEGIHQDGESTEEAPEEGAQEEESA